MTHEVAVSWVLPLYRTRACVEELLARVHATACRMRQPFEVLLVDDACPEESGRRAADVLGAATWARVIYQPTNVGQDCALRAGLRACRGRWAVLLDADLQDPPEAVAHLWERRAAAGGAVFADRRGNYTTAGRRWTSRMYRRVVGWAGGLPAGACNFVLLERRLIDAVASTSKSRVSILAAISAAGGPYVSVPVTRAARPQGQSAYDGSMRFGKAMGSLWQIVWARHLGFSL
ncbi:MAG TPA: glycosyltransferase [Myxococcota bacterium]|nr:glycosyltransferase [Myxococcota bacterium]